MRRGTRLYPLFEVIDVRTGDVVSIVFHHVRAIYPVRIGKREEITRIEYTNGDVLDSSDNTTYVLAMFYKAMLRGKKRRR